MKILKNLLLCFLCVLVSQSCEPPVVFEEPFMVNIEPLTSFPENFQGIYACRSDSSIIVINDNSIYAESHVYFEEALSNISAKDNCTLIGDEIYLSEIEECIPYEYISDDSIRGQYYLVDSLFKISPMNTLKPFKGHLVLSQYLAVDEWMITLLSLDQDANISYRAITEDSDMERLGQITPMVQIDNNRNAEPIFRVKPTKTQFETLFEDFEIFIECEYLIRVNLENDFYLEF